MINLDKKYTDLVDELTALNAKFNLFINGDLNDTIATDAGPVKSLASLQRDITSFKYVQKIIDHKAYADMVAENLSIETGMLIRVWGDNDMSKNGVYKKVANAAFTKIIYSDIYDLRDYLPNPWNYRNIKKSADQFANDINILTVTLPNMVDKTFDEVIDGDFKGTVDFDGKRGSFYTKFKIHLAGVSDDTRKLITLSDSSVIALDDLTVLALTDGVPLVIDGITISLQNSEFPDYTMPALSVTSVTTINEHVFTISMAPFKVDGVNIPARLDMNLYRIDSSKYKVL